MKDRKKRRIRAISKVPAMASSGEYTLTRYPAALKSASSTIQIPPHIIPIAKTYDCYGDVCFKTELG